MQHNVKNIISYTKSLQLSKICNASLDYAMQCNTKKALSTIMSATTNQCFHTNAVMDEYITELAACLMQKPNVLM